MWPVRLSLRWVSTLACVATVFALGVAPADPPAFGASPPPVLLTYLPAGFVDSMNTDAQVNGYLADLDTYGINQALLELGNFTPTGLLRLSAKNNTMIPRWVTRTAQYDAAHSRSIDITAVLNCRVNKGLNLDNSTTRTAMVASIMAVVRLGVSGVQLDLEPYPTTSGLLSLFDQLHAALSARGSTIRLSVVAPATTTTWSPTFLQEVSVRVDQLDPTYYDSGIKSAATYEAWVAASLAYYATNTSPHARIVPVLPSYKKNMWHRPAVENIATAASALSVGIAGGSRIDGAGIWWWWGFFYGEGGKYVPGADEAAWQAVVRPRLGA